MRQLLLCTVLCGLFAQSATAITLDGYEYSTEIGVSLGDLSYLVRGGIGFPLAPALMSGPGWKVDTIVEVFAGHWQAKHTDRSPDELVELGVTGIAQLSWHSVPEFFLEASTGASLLSEDQINGRAIGSHVQFASHGGFGWRFDPHWSLSYRFEHLSNAGLATPNPGVDYHLLNLRYRPDD